MKNKITYELLDGRSKTRRQLKKNSHTLLAVAVLGSLAGAILAVTIFRAKIEIPAEPVKPTVMAPMVVQVQAAETPFCYDPITCIRDVGEELGKSNQEILMMIRIAKAESGLRPDAINKNSNGTFDLGVFQINDVHSKRISRTDRMDFVKNIRFAWQLQTEQGFNPWVVYKKGLVK